LQGRHQPKLIQHRRAQVIYQPADIGGSVANQRMQLLEIFDQLGRASFRQLQAGLEAELPNLRAALGWSLDPQADIAAGLDVASFPYFWDLRGHIGEVRDWLGRLLSSPAAAAPTVQRARGLATAAYFALMVGDHAAALARVQEAVPLARSTGDPGTMWFAISVLGHTFRHTDPSAAEPYLREADAIARAADYPAAVGDPWILGECRRAVGDLVGARLLFEECLETARTRQVPFTAAFAQRGLGHLDWMAGEYAQAEERLREALRLQGMCFTRGIADVLEALAWNAASGGHAERAARLLGAAGSVRESLGVGIQGGHAMPHEQAVLSARTRLGSAGFEAASAIGHAWSADQAVEWALDSRAAGHAEVAQPGPLTAREREVARLLAQDYTNRQIAEALVIAERTVETHVTNILTKLDLKSRVQVGMWAVSQGLAGSGSN